MREGDIPERVIVARVTFDMIDVTNTAVVRDQQRRDTLCYYENHLLPHSPLSPLSQLQSDLKQQVLLLLGDQSYADFSDEQKGTLARFLLKGGSAHVLVP